MACISTTLATFYKSQLDIKIAQLTAANTALEEAFGEPESFGLDTGEERQTIKNHKIKELEKTIANLEARILWLNGKLNGGGIVNMNLRRHG